MAFGGATGNGGELRVGGRVAAHLGDWSMERDGGAWVIHAALVEPNPLWLGQAARYDLRLNVGAAVWRWARLAPDEIVITDTDCRVETRSRFEN